MTFKPEPDKLRDYEDIPLGDLQTQQLEQLDAFVAKRWDAIKSTGWDEHPLVRYAAKHGEVAAPEVGEPWELSPSTMEALLEESPAMSPSRFRVWAPLGFAVILALGVGLWLGVGSQWMHRPNELGLTTHKPQPEQRRQPVRPTTKRPPSLGFTAPRATPAQKARVATLALRYPWVNITCFVRPNTPASLLPVLRQKTGLRVTEKRSQSLLRQRSLNALWFGKRVPHEAVKQVSLLLLQEGIRLRGIRPFKEGFDKPAIIQIGADLRIGHLPVWTRKRVLQARTFTRRNPLPRGRWRKEHQQHLNHKEKQRLNYKPKRRKRLKGKRRRRRKNISKPHKRQ